MLQSREMHIGGRIGDHRRLGLSLTSICSGWHKTQAAIGISRFTRCTVPLPTPTNLATLSMPCPAPRCWRMACSTFTTN